MVMRIDGNRNISNKKSSPLANSMRAPSSSYSPKPQAYTAPARPATPVVRDNYAVTPASADTTRQIPTASNYINDGGGGGSATESLFGSSGGTTETAAAPMLSEEDYLAGDKAYTVQLAALKAALGNFEADSNNRRSRYGTDFDESMVNLGWQAKDNPDTVDVDEAESWNWNDTNYAAGRARQNTENDFASRGMMQSSLFGEATNNLERSLNDQRGGMVKAKTGFEQDLDGQLAGYKAENTLSGSQARLEALARRSNGIAV